MSYSHDIGRVMCAREIIPLHELTSPSLHLFARPITNSQRTIPCDINICFAITSYAPPVPTHQRTPKFQHGGRSWHC